MPATDMPLHYAGASRRYLLNSAVITAEGLFRYRLVTADEAKAWCLDSAGQWLAEKYGHVGYRFAGEEVILTGSAGGEGSPTATRRFATKGAEVADAWKASTTSTIGYEQTADALSELLGLPVAVDRRTIAMAPGDEALVFRLVLPPGTPRIDPGDKGRLAAAVLAGQYELGLLTRES